MLRQPPLVPLLLAFLSLSSQAATPWERAAEKACDENIVWACWDDALAIKKVFDDLRSGLTKGLPPIVVPPVIASFDPFAVSIAGIARAPRRDSGVEWDPVTGFGDQCLDSPLQFRMAQNFKKACLAGAPGACAQWAKESYAFGDYDSAIRFSCLNDAPNDCARSQDPDLFEKGCARGGAEACREAGLYRQNRNDTGGALAFYEQACLRGDWLACNWGGNSIAPQDERRALAWRERACLSGGGMDCNEVGSYYEKLGMLSKAREFWEKGCEKKTMVQVARDSAMKRERSIITSKPRPFSNPLAGGAPGRRARKRTSAS